MQKRGFNRQVNQNQGFYNYAFLTRGLEDIVYSCGFSKKQGLKTCLGGDIYPIIMGKGEVLEDLVARRPPKSQGERER